MSNLYETSDTNFAVFLVHRGATVVGKRVEANGKAPRVFFQLELPTDMDPNNVRSEFINCEFIQCSDIKKRLTTWALES
jgi:hypothetical protein